MIEYTVEVGGIMEADSPEDAAVEFAYEVSENADQLTYRVSWRDEDGAPREVYVDLGQLQFDYGDHEDDGHRMRPVETVETNGRL